MYYQNDKKMKKVFVLTETDSTDASWCYNEVFEKKEDAVKRLHELYHEDVVEREDLVVKSSFSEEHAEALMVDDVLIAWNIKETEVK